VLVFFFERWRLVLYIGDVNLFYTLSNQITGNFTIYPYIYTPTLTKYQKSQYYPFYHLTFFHPFIQYLQRFF